MSIQPDPMMIARVLHDTLMRLQADTSIRTDFHEPLFQLRKSLHACESFRQRPPESPSDEAPPQDENCDCEGFCTGACRMKEDEA